MTKEKDKINKALNKILKIYRKLTQQQQNVLFNTLVYKLTHRDLRYDYDHD